MSFIFSSDDDVKKVSGNFCGIITNTATQKTFFIKVRITHNIVLLIYYHIYK